MKIKPEHLQKLQKSIDWVLEVAPTLVDEYEQGRFNGSEKVKDLQKRFCFDLLYHTSINQWLQDEIYTYMDDTHLYTALKAVCPKINKRY